MSLCAVTEIAVHFESFRNIDLFHQGLYHLKVRIVREGPDGQREITAKPCGQLSGSLLSLETESTQRSTERTDFHNLIPAHIMDDQCTYSTRSYLIRYCEEEVELNEIGQFRLERPLEDSGPNYLEVDLMFADLTRHGGADTFGENPDVDSTEFKCVSTAIFKLRGLNGTGLHEFCPVVFDEYHFCLTNIVVHSVMLDQRFRLPNVDTAQTPIAPGSLRTGTRERSDADDSKGSSSLSASKSSSRLPAVNAAKQPAMSLAEALFGSLEQAEVREKLLQNAETLYQTHVRSLVLSHEKLVAWYKEIYQNCLSVAQREALAGATELPEMPETLIAMSCPKGSGEIVPPNGSSMAKRQNSAFRTRFEARLPLPISSRTIANQLAADLNAASTRIQEAWTMLLMVLLHAPREVALRVRESWEQRVSNRWNLSIVREAVRDDIAGITGNDVSCLDHPVMSEEFRKTIGMADNEAADAFAIQDLSMVPPLALRPLIFEERYSPLTDSPGKNRQRVGKTSSRRPSIKQAELKAEPANCSPSAPKQYTGVHLIVLVHGFQGNSFDMRLMRNNLALLHPDSMFLSSTCNEENTEGDVNDMGIRLAQEVVNYICDWCPGTALGRLSFIAHSLGGLIVRSCLPLLHEYNNKMFSFLTFSTSHLGIFQDKVSLFNTGFWMLKKWRNSTFLQQVSMTDHSDPRETFLFRLSKLRGFELFQNVVLASCCEDQYGPVHSARAEISPEWHGQADKSAYREMVENLWAPVDPEKVRRLDINFVITENNLDSFIGRTAHIQFLESQSMMKMIVHCWSSIFR